MCIPLSRLSVYELESETDPWPLILCTTEKKATAVLKPKTISQLFPYCTRSILNSGLTDD